MKPILAVLPVAVVCITAGAMVMADDGEDDTPVITWYFIGTYGEDCLIDGDTYFVDYPSDTTVTYDLIINKGKEGECVWHDFDFGYSHIGYGSHYDPAKATHNPGEPVQEEDMPTYHIDGFRFIRISAP